MTPAPLQPYSSQNPKLPPHFNHATTDTVYPLGPLISKATLSELDFDKLLGNLLLRHDFNFVNKIQYRPTTRGSRIDVGVVEAQKYWNAIGIELAGLFAGKFSISICVKSGYRCTTMLRSSLKDTALQRKRLMRLPQMFESVCEILKSLLPIEEWPAIDARLDVNLLVQELGNDVYDFSALSDWLGTLLRRFVLPERSHLVNLMTVRIRDGVRIQNVGVTVDGLVRLFSILEIMKLVSLL